MQNINLLQSAQQKKPEKEYERGKIQQVSKEVPVAPAKDSTQLLYIVPCNGELKRKAGCAKRTSPVL